MGSKIKLGVITSLSPEIGHELKKMADLGLESCQVCCWDASLYTDELVEKVDQARKERSIEITAIWTGYSGPAQWNFTEGPSTIGLVPPEYRDMRVGELLAGAEFAAKLGVASTITHAGFIPENPADPNYTPTVEALGKVAARCKELGLSFCFETGQETPVTLLRLITDIGTGNLGVNLDPANLLMYGKANPVDALDILGSYVKGVHGKDGDYPTNPNELGPERALGEGKVNYPVFVPKLKSFGFEGSITIEREISGDQQIVDIKSAMELLAPLL